MNLKNKTIKDIIENECFYDLHIRIRESISYEFNELTWNTGLNLDEILGDEWDLIWMDIREL